MKPITTWILLANASMARVVANHGPGKGFKAMGGKTWHADKPVEYADKPGVEHRGSAYGNVSYISGDPKDAAETAFATKLASELEVLCREERYERLIISAAPRLLGKLRTALPEVVRAKVSAEINKDLTNIPLDGLVGHLKGVIAA